MKTMRMMHFEKLLAGLESYLEWFQTGNIDGVGFCEQSIIDDMTSEIETAKKFQALMADVLETDQ